MRVCRKAIKFAAESSESSSGKTTIGRSFGSHGFYCFCFFCDRCGFGRGRS